MKSWHLYNVEYRNYFIIYEVLVIKLVLINNK